jgi:hypothetical protein
MEQRQTGDLVTVATCGPDVDGIVFDTPSHTKVVVAVIDPARGAVFRSVHTNALSERTEEGPGDRAMRLLIKRTPPPVHASVRGGSSGGRGRPGHTRGAAHRTTGR